MNNYCGICYFGECIARVIDNGQSENIETIFKEAENKTLVKYLINKYDLDIPKVYDFDFFEEYFFEHLIESRKSGIFNNGLLAVLCTILDSAERTTPKWS